MNAAICAANQTRPESLAVKSNFAIYHLVNVVVDFPPATDGDGDSDSESRAAAADSQSKGKVRGGRELNF